MRARFAQLPDISVIEDARAFAALEVEWEDLYRNAPLVTPFQSWAWLYSWWESYGKGYELRLVTMREGNLLVGLMPLMLERRWGVGRLLFVGTGLTDYQDVLAREGWETRVSRAGVQALKQIDGWHVADLQQLRPDAAAWEILEDWAGPQVRVWQDNSLFMEVKSWDELLQGMSKNLRSTARRTLRRAEADGVHRELASAEDAEHAAIRWVTLHREAWRGRDIAPEHRTERFEAHMEAAAFRMTVGGFGGISEFWQNGEVVASQFLIFGRDFVGQHLSGAREQILRRYQLSSLFIWDAINIALTRNSLRLDLLRGEEPYKLRWTPTTTPSSRVILCSSRILCSLYAGYHVLHSGMKRYTKKESTPRWLKSAANRYRTVRYVITRFANAARRS